MTGAVGDGLGDGGAMQATDSGPGAGAAQNNEAGGACVQPNERLLFFAHVLIGYKVEVQLRGGLTYEGIFHTMKIDGKDTHVVLKYAKVVKDPAPSPEGLQATAQKPEVTKVLFSDDLVSLLAKDVKMSPEDLGSEPCDVGFETDAAISRGRGGLAGRELVAWMPDEPADPSMFALEDNGGGGWDQFEVNRSRFGVETTFQEEIYTTKLDKANCGITEEEAARLAWEIEHGVGPTTNPHLQEERGLEVDDSGLDEEDKYSGVIRPQDMLRLGGRGRGAPGRGSAGGAPQPPLAARAAFLAPPAAAPAGAENGSARAPAWGRAGAGVAAVSGVAPVAEPPLASAAATAAAAQHAPSAPVAIPQRAASAGGGAGVGVVLPPPAASPTSGSWRNSPSGDIDPRKETNKIRQQITGRKDSLSRASPYGTPKTGHKSPLTSPLISDPQMVAGLNLEPGTTKFTPEVVKDFQRFKQMQQQSRGAAGAGIGAGALRTARSQDGAGSSAAATPTAAAAAAGPTSGAPSATSSDGGAAAAGAAGVPTGDAGGAAAPPLAAPSAPTPTPSKSLSKLNPNAKPFTLNVNAKAFVPGGGAVSSAALALAASTTLGSGASGVAAHLMVPGLPHMQLGPTALGPGAGSAASVPPPPRPVGLAPPLSAAHLVAMGSEGLPSLQGPPHAGMPPGVPPHFPPGGGLAPPGGPLQHPPGQPSYHQLPPGMPAGQLPPGVGGPGHAGPMAPGSGMPTMGMPGYAMYYPMGMGQAQMPGGKPGSMVDRTHSGGPHLQHADMNSQHPHAHQHHLAHAYQHHAPPRADMQALATQQQQQYADGGPQRSGPSGSGGSRGGGGGGELHAPQQHRPAQHYGAPRGGGGGGGSGLHAGGEGGGGGRHAGLAPPSEGSGRGGERPEAGGSGKEGATPGRLLHKESPRLKPMAPPHLERGADADAFHPARGADHRERELSSASGSSFGSGLPPGASRGGSGSQQGQGFLPGPGGYPAGGAPGGGPPGVYGVGGAPGAPGPQMAGGGQMQAPLQIPHPMQVPMGTAMLGGHHYLGQQLVMQFPPGAAGGGGMVYAPGRMGPGGPVMMMPSMQSPYMYMPHMPPPGTSPGGSRAPFMGQGMAQMHQIGPAAPSPGAGAPAPDGGSAAQAPHPGGRGSHGGGRGGGGGRGRGYERHGGGRGGDGGPRPAPDGAHSSGHGARTAPAGGPASSPVVAGAEGAGPALAAAPAAPAAKDAGAGDSADGI